MIMYLDVKADEVKTEIVGNKSGKFTDDESEIAELTAANRLLVAGLFQALELRGIFSAICDPLILQGEKLVLIERYKRIEANIRLAIEKSDR